MLPKRSPRGTANQSRRHTRESSIQTRQHSILPSCCRHSNFGRRVHMANLKLRDRDAIQSREGIIFRVFGYLHPPNAYICDAEYASSKIFHSTDPRAPREGRSELFYKFYNDEGMKLVAKTYPQYLIDHPMLELKIVGVPQ